ncbi:hypothetical protein HDE_12488 [Halotydeus destructor]|nr:hypothetical protein HDE_12488 [Halotydeus destructor]
MRPQSCLLYAISKNLGVFQCGTTKIFQTGTPFCAKHLREVFGIDVKYDTTRRLEGNHCSNFGPFLEVSPGIRFEPNCIIFPSAEAFESYKDGDLDANFHINRTLINWLDDLKRKYPTSTSMVINQCLKYWGSDEESKDKDQGTKCAMGERDVLKKAVENMEPHMKLMSKMNLVGGTSLCRIPVLMGYTAMHMIPSVLNNAGADGQYRAVANIKYVTQHGFYSLKTLIDGERLVLESTADADISLAEPFHHRREMTGEDHRQFRLDFLEESIRKAQPVASYSFNALKAGPLPPQCDLHY